jgi:phosphoglycerol transferase MdoB-like AlkP superfamily enzyme
LPVRPRAATLPRIVYEEIRSVGILAPSRARHFAAFAFASIAFVAAAVLGAGAEHSPGETIFCVVLMVICTLLLICVTRRAALSMLLVVGLVLLLRGISVLKMRYLGAPLFAPDLLYFGNGDTFETVLHYPSVLRTAVKKTLLVIFLLWLCWKWETPLWSGKTARAKLIGRTVGAVFCFGLLWGLTSPGGPFKHVHAKGAWEAMGTGSPLTSFVLSLHRMRLTMPVVDPSAADQYEWIAPFTPTKIERARLPDIVVVLEESTFDPRTLTVCTIDPCNAPMFDDAPSVRAHGPLRVHTFGGGTWTSEFALFSGLPHKLFGSGGFYAPYNLAPRLNVSLPRALKTQGYRNIAVYPMPATFVNASRAYSFYGFDSFHDANEMNLLWESTDQELEQNFEKIYAEERAKSDAPLFFMLLTMRQHGPHNDAFEKLRPPFDHPLFPTLDASLSLNLSNYLARMRDSDIALAHLQQMLFANGPAILVSFGDHHPAFDGMESAMARTPAGSAFDDPQSITYYSLRSNMAPTSGQHDFPVMDLAFLGGMILETAGVPKGAYFDANALMRERCNGHFLDCPDKRLLDSYLAFVFDRLHSVGN